MQKICTKINLSKQCYYGHPCHCHHTFCKPFAGSACGLALAPPVSALYRYTDPMTRPAPNKNCIDSSSPKKKYETKPLNKMANEQA